MSPELYQEFCRRHHNTFSLGSMPSFARNVQPTINRKLAAFERLLICWKVHHHNQIGVRLDILTIPQVIVYSVQE